MRERVEDLGRILVLVENILKDELFETRPCRNKDYYEWFSELTEEKREDILDKTISSISWIEEKLHEIEEIAEGLDHLNVMD